MRPGKKCYRRHRKSKLGVDQVGVGRAGNRANWDTNVDIVNRPLWPYTAKNASIYRCPSDTSYVVVDGVATPRVRSISMNLYLGGFAGKPRFDGGDASARDADIDSRRRGSRPGVAEDQVEGGFRSHGS